VSRQTPEATKHYRDNVLNQEKHKRYMSEYGKRPEVLETRKRRYRTQIDKQMLINARARAKKRGLDFNIDLFDVKIPNVCPILDIPIMIGEDKTLSNSPTIDRVDNNKGYTKGNVRVISHRANSMKNNNTLETLEKLIQYIKGEC
jgi:hypothetical protein